MAFKNYRLQAPSGEKGSQEDGQICITTWKKMMFVFLSSMRKPKPTGKSYFFNVIIFRVLDEIIPFTQFSYTKSNPSGYREITA